MLLKTTWREKEGGSFSELANYSSSMNIKDLDRYIKTIVEILTFVNITTCWWVGAFWKLR